MRKKKAAAGRGKGRSSRRRLLWTLGPLAALGALFWLVWPFLQAGGRFAQGSSHQPSRLYGRPVEVRAGGSATAQGLSRELEALGYAKVSGRAPRRAGEYRWLNSGIAAHLRAHATATGPSDGGLLEVGLEDGRVTSLRWRGERVQRARLEPPLIAAYYGPERAERRPVAALDRLPEELVHAVLAAEDATFFKHQGLSIRGIARAAWVNLRGGELLQGGSTVTQQLVKNLFLSHKRTLGRKLREAALALLIDLRYSKQEILQAYLNEIYWGASGSVNLIGVGAASWAYFGKRPEELDLCESALLAGMIQSPGSYSPGRRPERAVERRDWVLGRMLELGWLEENRAAAARAEPLCYDPQRVAPGGARYFADAAAAEAERRFEVWDLADSGYLLFSTVEAAAQREAEKAVEWGLGALERGWEKGHKGDGPLQSALVSLDPRTGAVLAWVGGRDYGESQFDRVSQARRQAGSAFKPVVYAAAFENGTQAPSAFVEDAPLTVALAGRDWTPQNNSGDFRGWVTVRTAVENSLNIPTVRVALDVGLDDIVSLARAMGVRGRLSAVPSLALGAFEVTPLELATVYATVAAGGLRPPVHSLSAIVRPDGAVLTGQPLPAPARALSAESAYLLTSVLQGVMDRGTGSGARHQGLHDPLAGKTGTTNDRRDSWFVGYSPDRVSLVWVGYDDNAKSRLSGSRAALPIWTRFTYAVRPERGYPAFEQPRGIVTAVVDPLSGELATGSCPTYLTEVFREGNIPTRVCHLHADWRDWRRTDEVRSQERKRRWEWLRKIFRKKSRGGG